MGLLFRCAHSKTLAPVESFVSPRWFGRSWRITVDFTVGRRCHVVGNVDGAGGSLARRQSMPVLVRAGFLGGFLFTVVKFPREGLRAACVFLFRLAVRIQSTSRVAESTERARELTPGIKDIKTSVLRTTTKDLLLFRDRRMSGIYPRTFIFISVKTYVQQKLVILYSIVIGFNGGSPPTRLTTVLCLHVPKDRHRLIKTRIHLCLTRGDLACRHTSNKC